MPAVELMRKKGAAILSHYDLLPTYVDIGDGCSQDRHHDNDADGAGFVVEKFYPPGCKNKTSRYT